MSQAPESAVANEMQSSGYDVKVEDMDEKQYQRGEVTLTHEAQETAAASGEDVENGSGERNAPQASGQPVESLQDTGSGRSDSSVSIQSPDEPKRVSPLEPNSFEGQQDAKRSTELNNEIPIDSSEDSLIYKRDTRLEDAIASPEYAFLVQPMQADDFDPENVDFEELRGTFTFVGDRDF